MNDEIEKVNHPGHYQGSKYEVIDIIEDFKLNFGLGNAIKYILRCDKKGKRNEDLRKAIWYLQREIDNEKNEKPLYKIVCNAKFGIF